MDASDAPAMDAATLAVYERYTKLELVTLCRSRGWTGDNARTSKEELAAYAVAHGVTADAAPAAPATVGGNPADLLAQAIAAIAGNTGGKLDERRVREIIAETPPPMDMEAVRAIVADAIAATVKQPHTIIIKPTGERAEITEHTHPVFPEVVQAIAAGVNVCLVGPTQCGKTFLAGQVARHLGLDYGSLSCTAGTSESEVKGWLLPVGDGGKFEYVPSQFVTLFEQGNSMFLFDEMDAADANFLLTINSATANGHMHIAQRYRQPLVKRGVNAAVMAACNTYGTGPDAMFVGRNQLDASTRARFYFIPMDYDRNYEVIAAEQILGNKNDARQICEWVWNVRDVMQTLDIRRVMSTTTIKQAAAMLQQGAQWEHIQTRLLSGWTRNELAKIGR